MGDANLCERLCAGGADANSRNQSGSTPLLVCGSLTAPERLYGVRGVIFTLLRHGATLEAVDQEGHTVFDVFSRLFEGASFFELMQEIAANYPYALPEASIAGHSLSRSQWEFFVRPVPVKTGKVYLLGDSGVGKTTLRRTLQRVRDPGNPLEHERGSENEAKRTLGIEFEYCRWSLDDSAKGDSISIQDHTDQFPNYICHDIFCDSVYAIYVIVIRLDLCNLDDLRDQLRYWLMFLSGHPASSVNARIMVVLSGWQENARYAKQKALTKVIMYGEFCKRVSRMRLAKKWLHLIDCRESGSIEVSRFRSSIWSEFMDQQLEQNRSIPWICANLREFVQLADVDSSTTRRRFVVNRERLFEEYVVYATDRELQTCRSEPLLEKGLEYLQQTGDLLLLPGSWIALDPNLLTNKLLHDRVQPNRLYSRTTADSTHAITAQYIQGLTCAALSFDDMKTLSRALEHLCLCIRYPTTATTARILYLSAFVRTPLEVSDSGRRDYNVVGMRCRLTNLHSSIYPGYFSHLFVWLYDALISPDHANHTSNIPVIRSDGIVLHRTDGYGTDDAMTTFDQWVLVHCHANPECPGFDVRFGPSPSITPPELQLTFVSEAAHAIDHFIQQSQISVSVSILHPLCGTDHAVVEYDQSESDEQFPSLTQAIGPLYKLLKSRQGTELHKAANQGRLAEVERLCYEGYDVNYQPGIFNMEQGYGGWTPLHCATEQGHLHIVECLCQHGAEADVQLPGWAVQNTRMPDQYKGGSPLHIAAAKGYVEICEYLCASGANVNLRNQWASTPLLICGALTSQRRLNDVYKVIFILLRHGATLEAVDQEGQTAFVVFSRIFEGVSFFRLMQKIVAEYPHALPEASIEGHSLSRSQWQLILNRTPIQTSKVFLLGDGGVGKTTLRKALQRVRDPDDPLEHEDDPENEAQRTLGIEFDYCCLKSGEQEVPICFQDHGGQRSFHILHDMFLESAYAIYAIVIRMDRCGIDKLEEQLRYWLRFLCSVPISGGRLVVALGGWQENCGYSTLTSKATSLLKDFQVYLNKSSIRLLDDWLHVIDCRKSGSSRMARLRESLARGVVDLQKDSPRQMPSACNIFQQFVRDKRVAGQITPTSMFSRVEQLLHDFKATRPELDCIVGFLFQKMCEYLQRCGELLLLPESLVVLAPNVFTNEIVGRLFRRRALSSGHATDHILTLGDIERLTRASDWFHNIAIMPLLLEHLGLCLRYSPHQHSRDLAYFPAFVQTPLAPSEHPSAANKIGMHCRVFHPNYRTFYPGFFPRLFARLHCTHSLPGDPPEPETSDCNGLLLRSDAIVFHHERNEEAGDLLTHFEQWHWVEAHADLQGFDVMSAWEHAFPHIVHSAMYTETAEWLKTAAVTIDSFIRETCNQFFDIRIELMCPNLDRSDHPELSQQYDSFDTAALMLDNIVDLLSEANMVPGMQAMHISQDHQDELDPDVYDEQLLEEEIAVVRRSLRMQIRGRRG